MRATSDAPTWGGGVIGATRGSEREAEAIEACLRGRVEGLALLYDLYRLPVFRTCLRLLGERSAAEDATQEVFLRVFERLSDFGGRSAFSTWLYRLTVNYCLNVLDKKGRRATVPLEDVHDRATSVAEAEESYARVEERDLVVRLLGQLSVEHRTILVLREIEDLSYREIAAVLEVAPGTVMSRLSRAREALRQLWLAEAPRCEKPRPVAWPETGEMR